MSNREVFRHKQARAYRFLANISSDGRKYTSPFLGFLIATELIDDAELQVALVTSEASDFWDGFLGKKSHDIEPNSAEKIEGGARDRKADQWLYRSVMSGLAVKALRHRQFGRATLYAGLMVTQGVRDVVVENWRNQAGEKGNKNTGAIQAARLKTALNDIGMAIALDRGKHIPHSERFADMMLVGGATLSLSTMGTYRTMFVSGSALSETLPLQT
ncbi:MAG: hypothetical protein V4702_03595 [Patescibacteria group bacterium]